MKLKQVLIPFIFILFAFPSFAVDTLRVTGIHNGKNLYVQNLLSKDGEYCTIKVVVNGRSYLDSITSSTYEIDLSGIPVNTEIRVEIIHKENCKPRILNPTSIPHTPSRKFSFAQIEVKGDVIHISTKAEAPSGKMIVSLYENNKWKDIAEVKGKGSAILNNYTVPYKQASGAGKKIRARFIEKDGKTIYSEEIIFK